MQRAFPPLLGAPAHAATSFRLPATGARNGWDRRGNHHAPLSLSVASRPVTHSYPLSGHHPPLFHLHLCLGDRGSVLRARAGGRRTLAWRSSCTVEMAALTLAA
jgi:hypothetical protein